MDIERELKENTIFCLTETQKKIDDIKMNQGIHALSSMRNNSERKGGGLMIIYRSIDDIFLEKIENANNDILITEGNIGNFEIMIIITYFRTGNTIEIEDYNKKLRCEIEFHVKKGEAKESNIIILGDFNGHLGYLGYQEENRNGKIINEMIENNDLILLNIDIECEGVYTWERGSVRSAIDLAIVNKNMYKSFLSMLIDEEKQKFDLSDHNLAEIRFNFETRKKPKNEWIETEYYKFDEEGLNEYLSLVRQKVIASEEMNLDIMNSFIYEAAEQILKKTYKKKIDSNNIEEAPWVTEEIRKAVKYRKVLNRKQRNEKDPHLKNIYFEDYKEFKSKVAKAVIEEMWKYEDKISKQIADKTNNNRNLYDNIKKLKGENRVHNNELKIFSDKGEELDKESMRKEIIKYWGTVYKMHKNEITTKWNEEEIEVYMKNLHSIQEYGEEIIYFKGPRNFNEHMDMAMEIIEINHFAENTTGFAKRKVSDKNNRKFSDIDDKYRKMSILDVDINDEDVEAVLKRLKNKKAPGPDGLKNEMYKKLGEDRITLNAVTECYANLLEGQKEPPGWKESITIMIPKSRKPTVGRFPLLETKRERVHQEIYVI